MKRDDALYALEHEAAIYYYTVMEIDFQATSDITHAADHFKYLTR